MHNRQHGFTLIEMMIVIAVIGVLAAIAGIAYSDYITRAQAIEAFYLGDGIKTPLAEYAYMHAAWPVSLTPPSNNSTSDTLSATLTGKYGSVSPKIKGNYPEGTITYEYSNLNKKIGGETVEFTTADGGYTWTCTGGSLKPKFRPAACR